MRFDCSRSRTVWLMALIWASAASAATFTVTNTADAGAGSLRQAILDSEGSAGADTIVFQTGVTGTVNLASTLPLITQDLAITGPGSASVSVNGGNTHRVLFVGDGTNAATVTVSGLTLQNGAATGGNGGAGIGGGGGGLGAGGALFVNANANVVIEDVALADNAATGGNGGLGGVGNGTGGGGGGGLGGLGGAGSTDVNGAQGSGGGGGGFLGEGGAAGTGFAGGGGGGYQGDGGVGSSGGGGGGGGQTGSGGNGDVSTGTSGGGGGGGGTTTGGGNATGDTGGTGGAAGGGAGGNNGVVGSAGANGGVGGGGGGGGGPDSNNGGNGGLYGGGGGGGHSGDGGNGGAFGGGGGGSFLGDPGGQGGDFGGGGGAAEATTRAGAGGFGAGGGGNVTAGVGGGGGNAGFGGGNGGAGADGEGGSAFGGALFVRQGGTLTLRNVSVNGSSLTAGTGAQNGNTEGSGIYLNGGTNLVLDAPAATSAVIADSIGGAGRVVKTGAGRVALTATNTYTDGTAINSGVLMIAMDSALGNMGGAVTMDGGTLEFGAAFSTARTINLNAGGGTFDTAGFTSDLAGGITGSGAFTKAGAGTLTMSGAASYLGATNITGGTLQLTGSNERLPNGTAVTVSSGAIFDLNGFTETVGSLAGAGNVTLGTGSLTAGGNNTSTVFSGTITGTGGFTKAGSGTMTISGANAYTGLTSVTAGTLALGANESLSDATTVNVGPSGTFDLAGFAESVAAVTGSGQIVLGSGALTVGGTGLTSTFGGVLSGTGSFTKAGTGILTLAGSNTYTGATNVTGGTLRLGAANRLSDLTAVDVAAGGVFDLAGFSETIGTLTGSGSVTLGVATLTTGDATNTTFAGVVSGTGGLTKAGAGTMTLSGANTYTGATTIAGGVLQLNGSERLANVTAVTISPGASFDLAGFDETIGSLAGDGTVTMGAGSLVTGGNNTSTLYTGAISGGGSLTKVGGGVLTLTGVNTYSGGTFINGGAIQASADANLGAAATPLSFDGGTLRYGAGFTTARDITLMPGGGTFDTNGQTAQVDSTIVGGGRLTKTGAGVLTLTGTNTYGGGTSVTGGVLAVSADENLGAALTTVTLDNGGALRSLVPMTTARGFQVNAGGGALEGNFTVSSVIAGPGNLTVRDGRVVFANANTFSGGLTLTRGTAVAASDANIGSGTLTFNDGRLETTASFATARAISIPSLDGQIVVPGVNAITMSGAITGAGRLVKQGAGTLNLTGVSGFTGQTVAEEGILNVSGDLRSSVTTVSSGARLMGTGTVGGLNALPGSTVAPGASIGTMSVNGNVNFAAGSTYEVEANAAGASDRIVATGTATLGGTVAAQPQAGTYNFRTSYPILTANGGLISQFANVTNTDPTLQAFLFQDATTVFLVLQRLGAMIGTVDEQNANTVSNTINGLLGSNTLPPGFDAALNELGARSGAQLEQGLRELANEEKAAASTAALASTLQMQRAVLGLMQLRRAQSGAGRAQAGTGRAQSGTGRANHDARRGSDVDRANDRTGGDRASGGGARGDRSQGERDGHEDSKKRKKRNAEQDLKKPVALLAPPSDGAPTFAEMADSAPEGVSVANLDPAPEATPASVDGTRYGSYEDLLRAADGKSPRRTIAPARAAVVRTAASEVTGAPGSGLTAQPRRGRTLARKRTNPRRSAYAIVAQPDAIELPQIAPAPKKVRTTTNDRQTFVPPPPTQNRSLSDSLGGLIVGSLTQGPDDDEVWAMAVGQFGDIKGTPGARAAKYDGGGVVAGRGWKLDQNLTVGVHGGFVGTEVRTTAGDRTGIQSYRLGVYGSYDWEDMYVDAIAQATHNDNSAQRRIALGAATALADGNYDGTELGVYGEFGRNFHHDGWTAQPFAALQLRNLHENAFTEVGAGALNLNVQQNSITSFQSYLGGRLFGVFSNPNGSRTVPGLSLAYVHEFADLDRSVTSAFVGTPRTFLVNGRSASSGSVQLRAGVTRVLPRGLEVDVSYAGEFSSAAQSNAILATGIHRF